MDAPPVQYAKTSDGYDIAYSVCGEGLTLIRVPVAFNYISRQWTSDYLGPLFDALAERFRLVVYDGRGQGLSTRGLPESLALGDFVSDLETVADRAEPGQIILMGMGSMAVVAIKYAVEHPERVTALVLWDYSDYSARPATLIEMARKDWPRFVDTAARIGFPEYDPVVVKDVLFDAITQPDLIIQHRAIAGVSGEDLMRSVKVPTLLLSTPFGSRYFEENENKRWAALLPDARLLLITEGKESGSSITSGSDPAIVPRIADYLQELQQTRRREGQSLATIPHDESDLRAAGALEGLSDILSVREIEVLRLITFGRSNQQIADELVISLNTVRKHVSNIFDKTGTANRTEAAGYARDRGLT